MKNFFKNIFHKKSLTIKVPIDKELQFDQKMHNDNLKKSIDDQIKVWRHTDLKLNDPATEDLIKQTQEKIGYEFPNDFIKFYTQVNGFKDWDIIGEMFSIWPLERIAEEYEKCEDKNFIPFCDYCIDCHRIGYLKDQNGVYKDYDQTVNIADRFDETIELIIEDSSLLY